MIIGLLDELFKDSEELDILDGLLDDWEENADKAQIKIEKKFNKGLDKLGVFSDALWHAWDAFQDSMENDEEDDSTELETLALDPIKEDCLPPYGLSISEALERAERSYQDFQMRMKAFGFPLEDQSLLYQVLAEYAQQHPSPELLRLYCDIICDTGFLLDSNREQYTKDSIKIQAWSTGKQNADELYSVLSEQAHMALQFHELISEARKIEYLEIQSVLYDSQIQQEIYKLYKKLFRVNTDCIYLSDNIAYLLQVAESVNAFSVLKPLFFYRMLTLHGKRLQKTETIQINFKKLWEYKTYRIDTDNGKNHKTYLCYFMLFYRLCKIFESDTQVILPLNCYGFEYLSNLGDFYRTYMQDKANIPFLQANFDVMDKQNLLFKQLMNIKDIAVRKYMEAAAKFLVYKA